MWDPATYTPPSLLRFFLVRCSSFISFFLLWLVDGASHLAIIKPADEIEPSPSKERATLQAPRRVFWLSCFYASFELYFIFLFPLSPSGILLVVLWNKNDEKGNIL